MLGTKSIRSARDVSVLTHGAVTPVLSNVFFFFKKSIIFILCVWVFSYIYACVSHVFLVPSEARREHLEPLKLELQAIIGHYVGAGN